ncbi:MAG: thioredoxin-disulfide reductase [Spirochaetia bacterium]
MANEKDLIIIGAGAAGLTAAQYGARANLKTLVLEELASGGQSLIIEGLENYPGFPEPINGMEFAKRFEDQAKNFGAEFEMATAESLKKEGDFFIITTNKGEYRAPAVIISTGAKHRHLQIPGEDRLSGKGVSYCATCDGPFFRNKKMIVVGGGDAACDEAMFLSKLTEKIILVHRRDRFRAQPSLASRVLNNKNIEVRFNTLLKEIHSDTNPMGMEKVSGVTMVRTDTQEEYREDADAVFVFIGSIPQTKIVPDVPKDEGGYIITNEKMSTHTPGLFAAGDVRATQFRQLVVAAAEGAIAAHAAAQYIDELRGEAY